MRVFEIEIFHNAHVLMFDGIQFFSELKARID